MGEYRKTFVNRIYTVGLTTCGSALVRIAGATESEGFQKVASFVNKWICGGNNTGQTLAEIQALCNEILNEVKIVDQHLKEYDAEIENTLQKIQYTEAKNELNQQWSKDIDVYETAGNVGNTLSAYEDYMKAAQLYMDGKTDINAVEKSKQKLYDNFIEVYKAAGNSFENPTDEKKKDAIFCNDTIDGVFKRSIWSMINALNKPSDEKNYADAAAQFAYRAYGFSGDQYNYIVSSIDKQFMEIIKMEMMYQEFIAQRGDYFEEKYPDDESKWESYAAWTNDLNKLNEDVAKAMDTMLDREILVSDSTVSSIRMKLDEFVKPEDMVSVRMKNENYHEKLTGEFYENEQPIIDAFNEGYLYLIEEYGWKSNADVITPFVNFHRIAVPTPKTEENPSGIDIYYIFDTSQPHDAEEDWAWNSDDSVPENLRFYQFEEKIDLTLARDQHIPSCDFINLTKENYSDGQNQFSCAKNTAEFQSLFATGLFSALSSIPGDYLSEYLLTKKDTKTYIALSDYDFDYHDAWATSYTIFHVVDTTGQYPGSSLESSTLSAEKIQPDKSAGAYSAYTVILKNRPQEDGYYKTKVDVATNGVGDTELEMVQEDGTTCQENIVPSGKEVTLRFKAEAAGLAIVNYGLIDECISGSNLSGPFTDQLTKEPKNLTETTTFVKGTSMAGGVVVENKGVIRNTANYAKATASASDGIAGGIAVVNSGTIENCMSIGTLSTKENGSAGGIVGKLDKNGSIQIAYSAQTAIEGGTTGAVFGTKEEIAGTVNNTYYLDTLSGNEEQGTAKTATEMKSNAFKEELNTLVAGNEELCSWTWNSTKNQGYPRILSSLITEVELVNASRGVTVKGMMHKDTKLQLNELDKKNDIYQAFKKYAQKTDKQVLYSAEPTLVYEDGQPSAYEGNLNVKLDLSKYRGKGYKVLVYRNNQIEELEIDKQMIASKDVEEMVPFAVLAEKSEISKAVDHIKDTIKTGDNSSVILLLCIVVVAGSVAGGVIYWRKKKAKK